MTTDTTAWPIGLQRLAEVVGPAAAMRLAEAVGGVRTYIPRNEELDHPLARIIGREAWALLVATYGGDYIEPPRGVSQLKKTALMQNLDAPARQLALRHGVTERYVKKLRADRRSTGAGGSKPRQASLFGDD